MISYLKLRDQGLFFICKRGEGSAKRGRGTYVFIVSYQRDIQLYFLFILNTFFLLKVHLLLLHRVDLPIHVMTGVDKDHVLPVFVVKPQQAEGKLIFFFFPQYLKLNQLPNALDVNLSENLCSYLSSCQQQQGTREL